MNWLKGLRTALVRSRTIGETDIFGFLLGRRIGEGRKFVDVDALDGLSRIKVRRTTFMDDR